ncbi:OmpA family protein [Salipaludibacillus sp. HK11]|uniref:OmpA family protein n=1 Tax=Salipaludibacillus sp. HK11 TaxID=3394320 RepID=UPI0039FDBECD
MTYSISVKKSVLYLMCIITFFLAGCERDENDDVENNTNSENENNVSEDVDESSSENDLPEANDGGNPFIAEAPSEPETYEDVIAYGEGELAHLDRDEDEEEMMEVVKDRLPSLQDATEVEMQYYWEALLYLTMEEYMATDDLIEKYELGEFDSDVEGVWYMMKDHLNVLTVLNIGEQLSEDEMAIATQSIETLALALPRPVRSQFGVRTTGGRESECENTELIYEFGEYKHYSKLPDALSEVSIGGEASLSYALEVAIEDFADYPSEEHTNVIYLVTNSIGSCDSDLFEEFEDVWSKADSDMVLNVIGINVSEGDQRVLEKVAEFGGGIYIPGSSEEEVEEGLTRTSEFSYDWDKWEVEEERAAFLLKRDNDLNITGFSNSWRASQSIESLKINRIIEKLSSDDYIDSPLRRFLNDKKGEREDSINRIRDIEMERLTVENEHNYRSVLGQIADQFALPGKPVVIEEEDEFVMLEIDETFLFDYDDDTLKPEAEDVLDEITDALIKLEGADVDIHGHTDSEGDAEYNQGLSERRAQAVKEFFEGEDGLNNVTFTKEGFGETRPTADNETEEGRAKNRRVEVWIEQH